MRIGRLLASVLAGVLLVNAVPHGVHGVSGEPFPSPFSTPPGRGPSTPVQNVLWSAANAIGGALLLRRAPAASERIAAGAGGVVMALLLAVWFGRVMREEPWARR